MSSSKQYMRLLLRLEALISKQGVVMGGKEEEDADDMQLDPELSTDLPWNTVTELLPVMRAIALHRYGQSDATALYNIQEYDPYEIDRWWPQNITPFYIHVRDPLLSECTVPGRRRNTRQVSLELCVINGRDVECKLADCKVDGNLAQIRVGSPGTRKVFKITKKDDGEGTFSSGDDSKPFHSLKELKALIAAANPGQVEVNHNGIEVAHDGGEVDDDGEE